MSAIVLQPFIERHPPGADVVPADPALLAAYADLLPASLLELWQQVGLGHYGGGLLRLVDPDDFRAVLCGWLMRDEDDGSRIPIALNAFGGIFYYRRLSDQGDEDISLLSPHSREVEVIDWSLDSFFNHALCNEQVVAETLETALWAEARAKLGPLAGNDIYCFSPAVLLGGSRNPDAVDRGDAVVHLSMLLQMVQAR